MTEKKNWKYKNRQKLSIDDMSLGKIPPNAVEMEEAVLGAILLEDEALDETIAMLSPNIFYKEQNRKVCAAIIELYAEKEAIDILTVTQRLKKNGDLETVGGAYYVSSLTNRIASSANIVFHVRILQQTALLRNLVAICGNAMRRSLENDVDVFELYDETQRDMEESIKGVLNYEIQNVGQIHKKVIAESYEVLSKGISSGVQSGWRVVDDLTNGWQKTDLIIWAGRPAMGKTASVISAAIFPALTKDEPVAIFSLEMSKEQLTGRMQSILSGVSAEKIIKKRWKSGEEILEVEDKASGLVTAPIYIDDTPNISVLELRSKARRLKKDKGIKLIVVDYLQLMRSGSNIGNREQEIAEISRSLKALAKELDIPVIALAQLSRAVESRPDKKPLLSDLRESGAIEQDADMVIFCYRPEYYGAEQYEVGGETFSTNGLFMLIIAKHRNGELGEIPLTFVHETMRVGNYNSVYDYEIPKKPEPESKIETVIAIEETKSIPVNTNFLLEGEKKDENILGENNSDIHFNNSEDPIF